MCSECELNYPCRGLSLLGLSSSEMSVCTAGRRVRGGGDEAGAAPGLSLSLEDVASPPPSRSWKGSCRSEKSESQLLFSISASRACMLKYMLLMSDTANSAAGTPKGKTSPSHTLLKFFIPIHSSPEDSVTTVVAFCDFKQIY